MAYNVDLTPVADKNCSFEIEIQKVLEREPLNNEFATAPTDSDKHRLEMRNFFNSMDSNHDGVVHMSELQEHMQKFLKPSLAKYIADQILTRYDTDSDGVLSFEEFYKLSLQKESRSRRLLFQYCKYVVPPREQKEDSNDEAYEESIGFCPPPLTMITFSIVQIIIYIICTQNVDHPIYDWLVYNPNRRSEIWRFVSYMFLHNDFGHILGNLILQIFLGVALELVQHWWRVSLVYVAGVLAGSLGHSLTSTRLLAGASAGVYALISAHIATVVMNWKEMYHPSFQMVVILIYCITDGYYSFNDFYYNGNTSVGYIAHLCGAIAGLLVGIRVLRNIKVLKWERTLWRFAVFLFVILMTAGIVANIFFYDSIFNNEVKQNQTTNWLKYLNDTKETPK